MNPFIKKFSEYGPLSEAAASELEKKIQYFKKNKYDFLLKQGQMVSSLFLMETGFVRAFFIKNDKEINSWFCAENMITGSILPIFSGKPSFENIQFFEDSELYTISVKDLNDLYRKFPELNFIGRKIAEELCVILEERITSLHTESAEERYQSLIAGFPNILQRVSLGHIASYLGITQETLSRIRKR